MFGYVRANVPELKIREYEEYRSYYCGLCHELRRRYGRKGQLMLSYDMTFLAMVLSGLYEPEETRQTGRCLVHPLQRHPRTTNDAVDYAADMTVLLAYHKAADDWHDDHSVRGRALMTLLGPSYRQLREEYPRQSGAIERAIARLRRAEEAGSQDMDEVASLTGRFLAEIYDWKHDQWKSDLRRMGFYLGKFIYLMDAWEDAPEDEKKGRYNVLLKLRRSDPEGFDKRMQQILTDTVAPAAAAFECLPVLHDVSIMRNVLYAGVWTRAAERKHAGKRCGELN